MTAIRKRIESIGFKATATAPLRMSKAGARIGIYPSGLCTSNEDLTDAIAPVLPVLLSYERKTVSMQSLMGLYLASERRGGKVLLRLTPRLESKSHWDELRSGGSCGLTPDEKEVFSTILRSMDSLPPLLTDFPAEGSVVRRFGRRQYYSTNLEPAEAALTLREIWSRMERNSYLPRDSLLFLGSSALPRRELMSVFSDLGDWCFLSLR